MAVTVVKTPQGHKIIDQAIAATITNFSGDAFVTFPAHLFTDGEYIYIDSDIDEYNGFWYVDAHDVNSFRIKEYPDGDYVPYYQDADVDYYQTNSHIWSSAFLPIVYKIENDRWPVNSVDTATAVSSSYNDNGYMGINTFGTIKLGLQLLDFIKISGSSNEEHNGVWQVVEVISNTNVVLDMPYNADSPVGAAVQFYYNNYQVKVKVYSGLPAGHPWEDKKPYVEVAELSLTPDENNQVMFSIADYIKGNLTIRNNPTLFSMPLNLDFFTGFYISTAESFDDSDGYTITEYESAYTDDTFEGFAMAGKLPFKNLYSGFYSNYVYTDGSPAQWLTLNERLLAVENRYFDLSFIKNIPGNFLIRIDKYIADYLTATEDVQYTEQGIGAYRVPIEADASYDSFCVTARTDPSSDAVDFPTFASWSNFPDAGTDWTTGATPTINVAVGTSDYLYVDFAFITGYTYTVTIGFTKTYNSGTSNPRNMILHEMDSSNNVITSDTIATPISPGGSDTASLTFTATDDSSRFAIKVNDGSNVDIELTSLEVTMIAPDVAITEEICIDMLESCDAASGFTPTDIRLLEDGSYRILE
jgi:hypothetical protein